LQARYEVEIARDKVGGRVRHDLTHRLTALGVPGEVQNLARAGRSV